MFQEWLNEYNKIINNGDNMEENLKIIEEYAKRTMQTIAKKVENELPKDFGFVVLAFKFNTKGQLLYVSNADRKDIVPAMEEWIEKTKKNFGNDTGKY